MKKTVILFMLISTLLVANSKSDKCEKMAKHIFDISSNSSEIKKALSNPKLKDIINNSLENNMKSDIDKCNKKFNKKEYTCIMKSTTKDSIENCKSNKIEKIVVVTETDKEILVEKNVSQNSKNKEKEKESKESILKKKNKCKKAMNYVFELTIKSNPQLKQAVQNPQVMQTLKSTMQVQMMKQMQNCIDHFDEDEYQCIMRSRTSNEVKGCQK